MMRGFTVLHDCTKPFAATLMTFLSLALSITYTYKRSKLPMWFFPFISKNISSDFIKSNKIEAKLQLNYQRI